METKAGVSALYLLADASLNKPAQCINKQGHEVIHVAKRVQVKHQLVLVI